MNIPDCWMIFTIFYVFLFADNHIKAQSKGPHKKGVILNNVGNNAQNKYDAPVLRSRNAVHGDKDDCSKVHNNSSNNQV